MIKKSTIEGKHLSAYCLIEEILYQNKDYYLTKEEIYVRMPCDEDGVPLVTIGSLESALRCLCHSRGIEWEYIRGKRYFAYRETKERY